VPPMNIAISGASGLVGKALCSALANDGHVVLRIVRSLAPDSHSISWDPVKGTIENEKLEGVDAIIHLAGEGIANTPWTKAKKERIYSSRIDGTSLIARTISELQKKPATLIAASAVGIYGHRPEEILTEDSAPGRGFLAKTCCDWELATEPARDAGVRVCSLRIGIVLDKNGGALEKMLVPFKLGVGGQLGSGSQHMSWISLNDLVRLFQAALATSELSGAINAVSPTPVTNKTFTKALASTLHRPALLPVPAFVLKALFRDFATEGLLADCAVVPKKALASGFKFQNESLGDFLHEHLAASEQRGFN
jgi:uncharacterized protein